jgi:hypothetical protein
MTFHFHRNTIPMYEYGLGQDKIFNLGIHRRGEKKIEIMLP